MTYTVFHIGAYVSLGAAVMAAGTIKAIDHWSLRLALLCMMVAGMCGGVIASQIPNFVTYKDFVEETIGPWKLSLLTYRAWASIEHAAFWAGVLTPTIVYLIQGKQAFD